MARKQKTENEIVVSSGAAAAVTRRKAVTTTRTKHSTAQAEMPAPSQVELPSTQTVPAVTAFYEPSFEAVSALAYSFWEARGYQGGSPEEDWLRAEQELRAGATSLA